MISALASLKSLIKTKSYHIDYPFFRLHYQVTASALIAFCLILTAKILFGDVIDCKSRHQEHEDYSDNICYSKGTSTHYAIDASCLDVVFDDNRDHYNMAFSNDKTQQDYSPISHKDFLRDQFRLIHRLTKNHRPGCLNRTIKYIYSGIMIPPGPLSKKVTFWHGYYRYIPIILFLQAAFFYLPHYLWKVWERGTVSSVCKQLHDNRFNPSTFIDSNYHLIDYLQSCFTLNKWLAYKYYFCHLLLLLNLIGQIIALNCIFNYQYVTYGIDVLYYLFVDDNIYGLRGSSTPNDELNNPMDFVFPKFTYCEYEMLSEGGGQPDKSTFLCVLPMNILHDKFFLGLWFWLVILFFLTIFQIIHDVLYITLPMLRKYLFRRKFGPYLSEDNRHSSSLPELFLLDLIGNNADKFAFAALLKKLNKEDCQSKGSETHSLV